MARMEVAASRQKHLPPMILEVAWQKLTRQPDNHLRVNRVEESRLQWLQGGTFCAVRYPRMNFPLIYYNQAYLHVPLPARKCTCISTS